MSTRRRVSLAVQLKEFDLDQEFPKRVRTKPIVIDELVKDEVGAFGLWQWFLCILGALSTTASPNFPVFYDSEPLKRCRLDDSSEALIQQMGWNLTFVQQILGGFDPNDPSQELSRGCTIYENWREHLNATLNSEMGLNLSTQRIPCTDLYGYTYEFLPHQYNGGSTIEFDLVCGQRPLVSLSTSMFMVGIMLGHLVGGFWGGRFGIKNALICATSVELTAAILCSVVPPFWAYTVLRLFVALGGFAKISAFNIILMDITIPRYRSIINAVFLMGLHVISKAFLALLSYFIRDWRMLNLAASSHCLFLFTYFFVVPESPRWLLANARSLDAIKVLQRGRRVNRLFKRNKQPSEALLSLEKQEMRRPSILLITPGELSTRRYRVVKVEHKPAFEMISKLFSTRALIRTTIMSILLFFGCAFVFMGSLLYTRMIRQSVYIVTLIVAVTGIPGIGLAIGIYGFFKRRRLPLALTYFSAACVLCIGGVYTFVVQPEVDTALTVCIVLSIMLLVTIQCMMFIYIPELYPSDVRSQGFGTSAGIGRIGSALCTFNNALDASYKHGFPVILYAMVSFLCCGITMCLADTTGHEGPKNEEPGESEENSNSNEDQEMTEVSCA